jgi:hypothetical protein
MTQYEWDIRLKGRAYDQDESGERVRAFPARAEMVDGKFFWSEEDRLIALAMLLENVGIEKAIRLGNPDLWREAIQKL